jgi:hypothetical protein
MAGSPGVTPSFPTIRSSPTLQLRPVVTPILQLSLVFRLFLSQLINRDHEVMNTAVLIGAFTAVLGSILVSLDTEELTRLLDLPLSLADFLHYRLAGTEQRRAEVRIRRWVDLILPRHNPSGLTRVA